MHRETLLLQIDHAMLDVRRAKERLGNATDAYEAALEAHRRHRNTLSGLVAQLNKTFDVESAPDA